MDRRTIGLVLVIVGIIGLLAFPLYIGQVWSRQAAPYWSWTGGGGIAFDEAVTQFQNYVTGTGDRDLAVMEVMEFENNFYAIVYEESTGIGAFELLIWKQPPRTGMMGGSMGMGGNMMGHGIMTGVVVAEPGPNMMWNTKYSMMRSMMEQRWQTGASSQLPVSEPVARSIAERYLSQNFPGARVEGITQFYGYYTLDFEQNERIAGMLSVNGYTGLAWYHSWHDAFIQEKELS